MEYIFEQNIKNAVQKIIKSMEDGDHHCIFNTILDKDELDEVANQIINNRQLANSLCVVYLYEKNNKSKMLFAWEKDAINWAKTVYTVHGQHHEYTKN